MLELMLASTIAGGVILATVTVYFFQEAQFRTARSRLDLSRDGYLTMLTIRDTVRFLTNDEYYGGATPLFYQLGDSLMRREEPADVAILNRVQPVGFAVTPNTDTSYIRIQLSLIDKYDQEANFTTIVRFKPE